MPIYFYGTQGEYGAFSNFARYGFALDGQYWTTSEHYFQAQKFAGTAHAQAVARARTAKEAAAIGRDRARPLRADWEQVKDDIMRRAVRQKFAAHPALQALLLGTDGEPIIEAAPHDAYWGAGADGTGKNMLGRILMEVRAELRAAAQSREDAPQP